MPKIASRYRATLSMAKYRSTCAKLRGTYVTLKALAEDDDTEFFQKEIIWNALRELPRVPDALRVRVCANCSKNGYYERPEPEHYGTSFGCPHPGVPKYDVRLDLWA